MKHNPFRQALPWLILAGYYAVTLTVAHFWHFSSRMEVTAYKIALSGILLVLYLKYLRPHTSPGCLQEDLSRIRTSRILRYIRRLAISTCVGFLISAGIFLSYTIILAGLGCYSIRGIHPSYHILTGLCLGIITPVREEILFRAILLPLIKRHTGTLGAIVISSLLFGVGHYLNPGFGIIPWLTLSFSAGIIFAVVYVRSKSLWMAIVVHWAWNFLQGKVLGYTMSGFRAKNSLLQVDVSGSDWITGSLFGPEGSPILALICIAACGVFILKEIKPRGTHG